MSRSSKKKPFVQEKLLSRIEKMNETGNKEVLKTEKSKETKHDVYTINKVNNKNISDENEER